MDEGRVVGASGVGVGEVVGNVVGVEGVGWGAWGMAGGGTAALGQGVVERVEAGMVEVDEERAMAEGAMEVKAGLMSPGPGIRGGQNEWIV